MGSSPPPPPPPPELTFVSNMRDVEKDVMLNKSFQKVILIFFKGFQYSFNYHVHVFSDIFCKKI